MKKAISEHKPQRVCVCFHTSLCAALWVIVDVELVCVCDGIKAEIMLAEP